jgi:hypothetical protein
MAGAASATGAVNETATARRIRTLLDVRTFKVSPRKGVEMFNERDANQLSFLLRFV